MAFAVANVILIFYTVVMVAQKKEVKRIHSASEVGRQFVDLKCYL